MRKAAHIAEERLPVQSVPSTEAAGLERERFLQWILAWAGLSAAWFPADNDPATIDLRIVELAARELNRPQG